MTGRLQEIGLRHPSAEARWCPVYQMGTADLTEEHEELHQLLLLTRAETRRRETAEALLDTALECAGYEVLVDGSRAPIVGDEPMYSLWEAWQQAKAEAEKEEHHADN